MEMHVAGKRLCVLVSRNIRESRCVPQSSGMVPWGRLNGWPPKCVPTQKPGVEPYLEAGSLADVTREGAESILDQGGPKSTLFGNSVVADVITEGSGMSSS